MLAKNQLLLRVMKTASDIAILGVAYRLAFLIRFEGSVPSEVMDVLGRTLPYVLLLKLICLMAFHVPSLTWRHASMLEAQQLLVALSAASATIAALRFFPGNLGSPSHYDALPFGALLIDYLLSVVGTVFLRAGIRWLHQRSQRHLLDTADLVKIPTIFIGAGNAGALVAKEAAVRPDLGIQPVGFLDDDPAKVGMIIHGLRVLGTTAALRRIIQQYGGAQALITIGHLSGPNIRRIRDLCAACAIPTKVIPGIREMVEGRLNLSAIRDVAIEDLLRRDPVKLDGQAIAGVVKGRTILVSGAGGSIGSELSRELCRFGPATLLLVEQAENGLFHIHRHLLQEFPHVNIVPCVADICDQARITQIFRSWRPSVVFHAAAHKHVPLMEWNPGEAVKNNVFGTKALADLADRFGVERFVMISTDKAVNPSSTMGVTKRVAEIYIQALSRRSTTRFVTVRFGNVLGSAGSVIPIFKEQIAQGGPVTITHPDMKRFFMTIPEACQLVLQAGSMGKGGEIFILDMGQPVKILDLARDLIRLSGVAAEDIEIRFTGLRPGEKLYEELSREEECIRKTQHPKIYIGHLGSQNWAEVERRLVNLRNSVAGADAETILAALKEIVPEYKRGDHSATEKPNECVRNLAQPDPVAPDMNDSGIVHIPTPSLGLDPSPAPAVA